MEIEERNFELMEQVEMKNKEIYGKDVQLEEINNEMYVNDKKVDELELQIT